MPKTKQPKPVKPRKAWAIVCGGRVKRVSVGCTKKETIDSYWYDWHQNMHDGYRCVRVVITEDV